MKLILIISTICIFNNTFSITLDSKEYPALEQHKQSLSVSVSRLQEANTHTESADDSLYIMLSEIKALYAATNKNKNLLAQILADFEKLNNTVATDQTRKRIGNVIQKFRSISLKPAPKEFNIFSYPALDQHKKLFPVSLNELTNASKQEERDEALAILIAEIKASNLINKSAELFMNVLGDFEKLLDKLGSSEIKKLMAPDVEQLRKLSASQIKQKIKQFDLNIYKTLMDQKKICSAGLNELTFATTQQEGDEALSIILSQITSSNIVKTNSKIGPALLDDLEKLVLEIASPEAQKKLANDIQQLRNTLVSHSKEPLFDLSQYQALSEHKNSLSVSISELDLAYTQEEKDEALLIMIAEIKSLSLIKKEPKLLNALLTDLSVLAHAIGSAHIIKTIDAEIQKLQVPIHGLFTVNNVDLEPFEKYTAYKPIIENLRNAQNQDDQEQALLMMLNKIKSQNIDNSMLANFEILVSNVASPEIKTFIMEEIEKLRPDLNTGHSFDISSYPVLSKYSDLLDSSLTELQSAESQWDRDEALVIMFAEIKALQARKKNAEIFNALLADYDKLINNIASENFKHNIASEMERLRPTGQLVTPKPTEQPIEDIKEFDISDYPALKKHKELLSLSLTGLRSAITQEDRDQSMTLMFEEIKSVCLFKNDLQLFRTLFADFNKLANNIASPAIQKEIAQYLQLR